MGPLIDSAAAEGARRVALIYLDRADRACERLASESKPSSRRSPGGAEPTRDAAIALDIARAVGTGPEVSGPEDAPSEAPPIKPANTALHDLRVAARRLSATLRAYREELGEEVSQKRRKQLRELVSMTGEGRDAEAQLEWIGALSPTDELSSSAGIRLLTSRLARRRDEVYAKAGAELPKRFAKLSCRLRSPLRRYTLSVDVDKPSPIPRFRDAVAASMAADAHRLVTELRRVRSAADETIAHDARIHGKRIRYTLAPLKTELPEARAVIAQLKGLQALLGDLNDLANLAATIGAALEEVSVARASKLREAAVGTGDELDDVLAADERPGLLALVRRLQAERARRFAELTQVWLSEGGRLTALADAIEALRAQLAGAEEGVEIERKYLLRALPPICHELQGVDIDQGYIPGRKLIERLRRKRGPRGEELIRTMKLGAGLKRIEVEERCEPDVFAGLWALTEGRRVRKRRFAIEHEGLVWEIDGFRDRDLVLAEVELPTEDTEAPIPDWLAPYLVREVTDEPAYLNVSLAR